MPASDQAMTPNRYSEESKEEQGLLKRQKGDADAGSDEDDDDEFSPSRWRTWSAPAWISFMALLIVMLLVGVWVVSDFSNTTSSSVAVGHTEDAHMDNGGIDHALTGGENSQSSGLQNGDGTLLTETDGDKTGASGNEVALGSNPVSSQTDEMRGVQTNDYLLDRNWDFSAPPQRREYEWVIRDHDHNPDGVYRPMILVNNQFPGPLVEVNEGDTIVVHVDNQAVNATAIHWHGIYQNNTPYMDGTIGVTQCPIAPGQTFTYQFTVSGQSGTYWWHSHQGAQSADGLYGPLIIHARDELSIQPISYDTDRVLLISDHYHDLSSALLWQYLLPDMENAEPVPQSGLVNGRNILDCDKFPDRKCDNTAAHVGYPRLNLEPNQRHRLRIINTGAFAEFQFQIDEHELVVSEVDGTDVEPVSYHRVNVNSAQRYSVIVDATSPNAGPFWLRARMITKCFTEPPPTLNPDVLGVVYYATNEARHEGDEGDEDEKLPSSVDWEEQLDIECRDMNTTELRPFNPIAAPAEPDAFFYLRSNFEIGAYRLSRGKFNSSSWRANIGSPALHRTINGLQSANDSFRGSGIESSAFVNNAAFDMSRELVIQTTGIQVVDLVISNFDDGNHPIHLHGYKYFVLAQGHGYPPTTYVGADITQANLAPLYESLDLSNPLRRDTASVEAFGWIMIRLVADNPGAWALHCHISWHTEAGLMMQLITRADELESMDVPSSSYDLCAAEGIDRGSGPRDEDLYQFAR